MVRHPLQEAQVTERLWRQRARLIRALGVKWCGQYGGQAYASAAPPLGGVPRWCWKEFGHEDSCAFDATKEQPGDYFRAMFRGWHR